jgi:hypothetical protein
MNNLSILEQARLNRKLAQNSARIKKLESLLKGQSLNIVKIDDAIITGAKIAGLNANKIESGIISIGEQILVKERGINRILISHDEIKVSKPGYDVLTADIKNLIILNQEDAHILLYNGYITSGTYNHSLSLIPAFFSFKTDSTSNPTYFELDKFARATTSQIINITNPSYLFVFREGA